MFRMAMNTRSQESHFHLFAAEFLKLVLSSAGRDLVVKNGYGLLLVKVAEHELSNIQ